MVNPLPLNTSDMLELANQESIKSHCFRAKVGAVITDSQGKILSTGFNAPPFGVKTSQEMQFCNKEKHGVKSGEGYHLCRSIHAEQFAILKLGIEKTIGTTLYVFGHSFICNQCKQYIVLAQIKEVFLQSNVDIAPIYINPLNWLEELSAPLKVPSV